MTVSVRYEIKKNRLCIYANDELWREVSTSIFSRRPALPASCLDQGELSHIFAELEYKGAKIYAYKKLARQNLSSFDLVKSLSMQLVSKEAAGQIIQELQQQGYINDSSWAESFIRQQRQLKKGRQAIAYKLQGKGFAKEQIEQLFASQGEPFSDLAAIQKLLETKYQKRDLTDYKEKGKVINSLLRKGFALDDVLSVIHTKCPL